MSDTEVFPYFLGRIGGLSFDHLEKLNTEKSVSCIDEIFVVKEKISAVKEPLCNVLHELIAQAEDNKIQNFLLNCKRNVFNEKPLKTEDAERIKTFLSPASLVVLKEYSALHENLQEALGIYKKTFGQEIVHSRNQLKKVATNTDLQKGLLLSSQLLLDNIPSYIQRDPAALRKKELKTEESLLKYLTRMGAKTSPFSTFTNLSLGLIRKEENKDILFSDGNVEMQSHICLNNMLYVYLKGLLLKLPEVSKWFYIRPNPTICVEKENFVFLINSNNTESFQRMPVNPVVELFHELLNAHKEGIHYQKLIDDILENEYFDASQEEIEGYINQLIEYGFIEYNIGVSGIDPQWDKKFVEVLSGIKDKSPLIEPVIQALQMVRNMAARFSVAEMEERKALLQQAYRCFRDMCMVLHEKAGLPEDERKSPEELQKIIAQKKAAEEEKAKAEKEKKEEEIEPVTEKEEKESAPEEVVFKMSSNTYFHFKAEQIFYEDTNTSITPVIDNEEVQALLEPIQRLLNASSHFDFFLDEKEKMMQFFENKYGELSSVDLMRFYEDFYRDVRKPEAEQQQKIKDEAKKSPEEKALKPAIEEEKPKVIIEVEATKKRNEENKKWLESFAAKSVKLNEAGDEIAINGDSFGTHAVNSLLSSFGCFAQVFRDEQSELKAVLNGVFPGFGKMLSRFLHLLDPALTAELRSWNSATEDDVFLIENCDASVFNANLHPPLMPFEVWMPGGQNTLPAEQQVPITALSVRYDRKEKELKLVHTASGKQAYVFDLGFQGHKGRSQLFQLLTRFSLTQSIMLAPFVNTAQNKFNTPQAADAPAKPVIRPRVVLENKLVLQRKAWYLKNALIPGRLPEENEADYFMKIGLWRKQLQLPDEVFIFITTHQELETLKPEQLSKLGRDSYKPQYINFKNPLLVNLFEKMISRAPAGVRIEEMLPVSGQMLKAGDKRYVTEFVLQWYSNVGKKHSDKTMKETQKEITIR